MKKYIAIFLFITASARANVDSVTIRGQITGDGSYQPSVLQIIAYSINDNTPLIVSVGVYNDFVLKVAAPVTQLYSIGDGRVSYDFLVSPTEPILRLNITTTNKQISAIAVIDSREDAAFRAFLKIHSLYAPELRNMCVQCADNDSCMQLFTPYYMQMSKLMSLLKTEYKGTYTAVNLANVHLNGYDTVHIGFRNYLVANLLNQEMFRKFEFYNTPVPFDLIKNYLLCFAGDSINNNLGLIRNVMAIAGGNDSINKILHQILFSITYYSGNEKMLNAYFSYCENNPPDNLVVQAKIAALKQAMPGNPVLEILLPDVNGTPQSLTKFCRSHALTLLVIWSPNCEHCQTEIPDLEALRGTYFAKGFDIYTVSIDASKSEWKDFVAAKKLSFKNVWQDPLSKDSVTSSYAISYTPTYIFINKYGEIISRFAKFAQLQTIVGNYFNTTQFK